MYICYLSLTLLIKLYRIYYHCRSAEKKGENIFHKSTHLVSSGVVFPFWFETKLSTKIFCCIFESLTNSFSPIKFNFFLLIISITNLGLTYATFSRSFFVPGLVILELKVMSFQQF